ncbi:Hsp20/alpha crystallin family protein [Gallalistipes aquisgranensis]|uniref:Hsp20/alpha crystallin family protein n=1 Tax=Gallalistipes aquisgranensis TaxID=2779358 RepID=UPI001CF88205|nr:Hsp20/alpha crystallin family protein [Gallalistipes aquisgranensis]MBE5032719.1 Hsp20/alpha crystallin family protein [Gallalistipes aquisgranensis]
MLPIRRTQGWLPDIFNDFLDNEWMTRANVTAPAVNVIETEKDYKVEIAAPGMNKGDFNVKINEDNQLVVSMEKKEEKNEDKKKGKYLRREFSYSQFQQTMILPDNIERDRIEAKMENGVLNIDIPKKVEVPEAKKEKQIEVK